MKRQFKLRTAGAHRGDLVVEGLLSQCGEIDDGITLRHETERGAWVVSFHDLERLCRVGRKLRYKRRAKTL